MRFILKERSRVTFYNNVVISLLCTSSLFTGYYKVNVDNEVKHTNARNIVDVDLEPLSQEANAGKVVKKSNKVTYVSSRQEVNTSNKGYYVPASYSSVTGEAVANYALRFLGLPYKRASQGTSLKTGTDCSGFTMLIYREFGVSLSRTPGGQMRNGRGVSRKELQKGDLVIYGRGSNASHVALYIGNGKVIHESTPGQGVKITGIDQMGMRILSYRRVINAKAIAKVEGEKKKEETSKVDTSTTTTNTTSTTTTTTNTVVEEPKKEEVNNTPVVADVNETTTTPTTTVETPKVEETTTTVETTTNNSVSTENE
jgi:cell wall-associated NlpC family hydrolase